MSIPLVQKRRIATYIAKHLLLGNRRFPLVLMLEPLFRCNLRCKSCGKNSYPKEVLAKHMGVEACAEAAIACGAPVVSIAGGEPLLHPEIADIARTLVAQERFVYLCTNALLVEERIAEFSPSPYLSFNIHLDGFAEKHDAVVCRRGVFDTAVRAIGLLLDRGFRVTTNSTFFEGDHPAQVADFLDFLASLKVEAMTIAPAFSYERAPERDHFLTREKTKALFQAVFSLGNGHSWRFNHSSLYLEFLSGKRDFPCSPWGNPTRNIFGWQSPCYLLDDEVLPSFQEVMDRTPWDRYGVGNDPRCAHCMVHSGYEATAVLESVLNPFETLKASVRGLHPRDLLRPLTHG